MFLKFQYTPDEETPGFREKDDFARTILESKWKWI